MTEIPPFDFDKKMRIDTPQNSKNTWDFLKNSSENSSKYREARKSLSQKISRFLDELFGQVSRNSRKNPRENITKKPENLQYFYPLPAEKSLLRSSVKYIPALQEKEIPGSTRISMKGMFASNPQLLEWVNKFQRNDSVLLSRFHFVPASGNFRQLGGVDFASTQIKLAHPENLPAGMENTIIQNEMMHVFLNQSGFLGTHEPAFPIFVSSWNVSQNAMVNKAQVHEFLSDYASIFDKNPREIKRQISGSLTYFFANFLWDNNARASLRPGYFYTEEVGRQSLEKIFGNLQNYIHTKKNYTTSRDLAEQVFRDMERKKITIDGKEVSGVEYFVMTKIREGERLLRDVVFPAESKNPQNSRVYMA